MFLTKKTKKFSYEKVLDTLKDILTKVSIFAEKFKEPKGDNDFIKLENNNSNRKTHHLKTEDILVL